MSVSLLFTVWVRLVTPAEPLHELTHMLVAAPFAREVSFERRPDGGAYARLEWPGDAPVVWVRLAHLAPTIVGVTTGVVVGLAFPQVVDVVEWAGMELAMAVGVPSAAGKVQLALGLLVTVNWVIFSIPSQQDLRPFQEP